jgi:hypothetical protein
VDVYSRIIAEQKARRLNKRIGVKPSGWSVMPLTDLWLHSRDQLEDKHVQQIIAFAGTGQLWDGNAGSAEFRDFLSHVPSNLLRRYADQCLQEGFSGSGFALQDIIDDEIVEILLSTAEEVKPEELKDEDRDEEIKVPAFTPVAFHKACIPRLEQYLHHSLLKPVSGVLLLSRWIICVNSCHFKNLRAAKAGLVLVCLSSPLKGVPRTDARKFHRLWMWVGRDTAPHPHGGIRDVARWDEHHTEG